MTGLSSDEISEWARRGSYVTDGASRPLFSISSSDEPGRGIPWPVARRQSLPPFRPATSGCHNGLRDASRFHRCRCWFFRLLSRGLTPQSALFARRFEFAVAFREDGFVPAFQPVARRHEPDR
jgi:hypothetical protein